MSDSDFVDVILDDDDFTDEQGRTRFQKKDFKTKGIVWRVHRYDPDPFPSKPHAHCIEGMYEGKKLHFATGEIYDGREPSGMKLGQKKFERLCADFSQHFPEFDLPLKL